MKDSSRRGYKELERDNCHLLLFPTVPSWLIKNLLGEIEGEADLGSLSTWLSGSALRTQEPSWTSVQEVGPGGKNVGLGGQGFWVPYWNLRGSFLGINKDAETE